MARIVLLIKLLTIISVASSTTRRSRNAGWCPDTWVAFGHSCYKLIKEKHSWFDAQNLCNSLGSYLVNIRSPEENHFVFGLAHNHGVSVWTGLSDAVQEGHLVWADSQKDPVYTHFKPGEPNNARNAEDCIMMLYEHKGLWNDEPCRKEFSAVCERPSDKSRINAWCPDTWVVFGHSCYRLIESKHRWFDSQAFCKTIGSNLVNIGSSDEDHFVAGLAHNHGLSVWIGLSDVVQEGHYVWVDTQEDAKYTHWRTGQPNNLESGNEDCALVSYDDHGLWHDFPCQREFAAVCEKPSKRIGHIPKHHKNEGEETHNHEDHEIGHKNYFNGRRRLN